MQPTGRLVGINQRATNRQNLERNARASVRHHHHACITAGCMPGAAGQPSMQPLREQQPTLGALVRLDAPGDAARCRASSRSSSRRRGGQPLEQSSWHGHGSAAIRDI